MATNTIAPRAFAVWWKDLHRWGVKSFQFSQWRWPPPAIKKLATALERRFEIVDKTSFELRPEHFLSLRFTGEVEPRDLHGKSEFKGSLFFAHAGDIIYSKIDVRNGAIGIVPAAVPVATVTSEFPVYRIKKDVALPEYIQLVFRTEHFRRIINGMVSGASGRKRVQPNDLENVEIPLPPLVEQKAIVERWRKAQNEIAAARERVTEQVARIQSSFLARLGLKPPAIEQQPKAFAVWWKDIFALSARATFLSVSNVHLNLGKYTLLRGRDCLTEIRHGCSAPPSPKPTGLEILKISAITRGVFVPTEKKYTFDNVRVRTEFDLRKGDVLLCRTNGTLAYVGMSALVQEDMANLIYPDKVIRVRVKENILPEYLWQVLQSHPIRAQIEAAARTAVGNYAIGTEDIWNLQIPVPPLAVQKQIMDRVASGREEVALEREAADRITREINAEIEALILGTKKLSEG
ncbi:MAG: hypothetical protein CVU64_03690 [Deltaproteobacteria bacterium HGW-Deltaproteobacteria-21]|nr:MAG: hypothetical protein CVU64_03690 [Deltaproteobacteria bacterium HGW-Deltaproteobacteria-21]